MRRSLAVVHLSLSGHVRHAVDPDLPPECACVGRVYFARSPGSEIWVCFDDLPEATYAELWRKLENGDFDHTNDDWPF